MIFLIIVLFIKTVVCAAESGPLRFANVQRHQLTREHLGELEEQLNSNTGQHGKYNMTIKSMLHGSAVASALMGACLASSAAQATEGYFSLGYGAVQRSMGGAGVAHTTEAMSAAINPAGVADVGRELQLGIQFFSPIRGYEGTDTNFVPSGEIESGKNFFLAPNMAYNMPLANGAVLNFSAYGNGGMNTTYADVPNINCFPPESPPPEGGGVFCGGPAGVDLMQLFLSATYAKKSGNTSFGIAPTIAIQAFEAKGLGAFGGDGGSADPTALTDNGHDFSYGYGLRAGIETEISETLRFGLAGQTKMMMSEFEKYSGLFENGGDFDIPASITAGFAYDVQPDLTLMLDYQYIFFSDIGAIGNAGNAGQLGAEGGAGFGWDDVSVIKVGAEWRKTDQMTWRAGYAYSSNPVGPEDVTLNILAPGIVTHHITAGGTYKLSDQNAVDFSFVYAPPNSVSGLEMGAPDTTVELKMHQASVNVGWTRKF